MAVPLGDPLSDTRFGVAEPIFGPMERLDRWSDRNSAESAGMPFYSDWETAVQTESDPKSTASRLEKLLDLLKRPGGWQSQDWKDRSHNEDYVLNDARIVGQVWFRGHSNCGLSLQPKLYREDTWKPLLRQSLTDRKLSVSSNRATIWKTSVP